MKKGTIIAGVLAGTLAMLTACGGKTETAEADEIVISQPQEEEETDAESLPSGDTQQEEAADTISEESTESAGNDSVKELVTYDVSDAYQEVLNKYQTLINEKWDTNKAFEEKLSSMVSDFVQMGYENQIGYVLYDLDLDGQPELLIGEMDTELPANRIVFDAYTEKDGKAVQLFESESRNRYYVVEDEAGAVMIANEGSNGAASSGWIYYIYTDGELKVMQAVMYDAAADEANPWFMAYDDDWDSSNDEPISESDAQAIIDSYTNTYAKLDWTALLQ